MKSLYKDKLPELDREMTKESGFAARLSETPENWPQEITSEFYKQLPFMSDYEVNVNLDRVEAQRGFAFGYADVSNKTERPEVEHTEAGLPHLRVPIIVSERAMKPLSTFLDGDRVMPLTEERIREKLFNPATFDLSVVPPQDPSLVEPLMPPHRSGIGMGGDYKLASADEKLLAALSGEKEKKAYVGVDDVAGLAVGHYFGKKQRERGEEHTLGLPQAASLLLPGGLGYQVGRSIAHRKGKEKKAFLFRRNPLTERMIRQNDWADEMNHPDNVQKLNAVHQSILKSKYKTTQADASDEAWHRALHEAYEDPYFAKIHERHGFHPNRSDSTLTEKHASAVIGFEKLSFKHISKEQWDAMYNDLGIVKLLQQYGGDKSHPAIQNKVIEMAAKMYGFHPKPEPPPPQKVQEFLQKQVEKQQQTAQKQMEKGTKMMSQGQKLVGAANGGGKNATKPASMPGMKKAAGAEAGEEKKFPSTKRHRAEQWSNTGAGFGLAHHILHIPEGEKFPLGSGTDAAKKMLIGYGLGRLAHRVFKGRATDEPIEKKSSLLLAIAPTISERDWDRFVEKVASDPTLRAGFSRAGVRELLSEVSDVFTKQSASAEDRLQYIAEQVPPTAVTVQKLPGGEFLVKSAANEAFVPGPQAEGQVMPEEQAGEMIGQDNAQAMQPGQVATAVANPLDGMLEPEEPAAEPVTQFGEYLVQDLMGNQVMGWVFPETLAWDGNFSPAPTMLFSNGSAYAFQDGIAGELIGKSVGLPIMEQPRGEGVFYEVTRDGARATAPITVHGGMTGPDGGPMYTCSDVFGNQFQVHISEGLVQPQRVSDTEYAIPATWKFMGLGAQQTQLVNGPDEMNKTSAARQLMSSVTLFWNGAFQLDGGCGLEKVGSQFRHDLDPVSAEFMLGVLGVPGHVAKQKLAQARKKGKVKLCGLHQITTLGERLASAKQKVASLAKEIPNLRRDTVKLAASMEDEGTVDKVLALNFINPENLATFVDYQPKLEETSEQLAEMLLSSYLGMGEIPEAAVEHAMKHMEEVSAALKAVQHAEA